MTDTDLRSLERALTPVEGPCDARHALTRERLRRSSGVIAWWPGPVAPHQSAARVTLAYETREGINSWTRRSPGWALAVGSVEDLLALGRIARRVTFLDLATGDWFVGNSRRSSIDLGVLRHTEESTTLDAYGRPRATVKAAPAVFDQGRFGDAGQGIRGTVREEAIYDTEWRPWRVMSTRTFRNYNQFSETAPRQKLLGVDVNMHGYSMPAGHAFDCTGFTVELFDENGEPLTSELHELAVNGASSAMRFQQSTFMAWPFRAVVVPPREAVAADPISEGYVIERPAPPILPLAFPFPILSLQDFEFSIDRMTSTNRDGGYFVRTTLSGFLTRGIIG